MHTIKRSSLLVLVYALFTTNAPCWGPEGHRIVAAIAFRQLQKSIKDKIVAILGDEDFVQVSNWADDVRNSRPETKNWHFVDIPVSAAKYDANRDCQELETGDCAVKELVSAGYKYPGFKVGVIPTQKVTLGQAYINKGKPVVDLQLARAGVRLARVLKEALGTP
jgi:hypothetical protein